MPPSHLPPGIEDAMLTCTKSKSQSTVDADEPSAEAATAHYTRLYEEEWGETEALAAFMHSQEQALQTSEREADELRRRLADAHASLTNMRKMLVQAGRPEPRPLDADIVAAFLTLKSAILDFTRTHLDGLGVRESLVVRRRVAPELSELLLQGEIATALWRLFFRPDVLPFGLDDGRPSSTLKKVERFMLLGQGAGQQQSTDELAEWRSHTIRLIKTIDASDARLAARRNRYLAGCAAEVWTALGDCCPCDGMDVATTQAARRDLAAAVCRTAYEAALLCRESTMEYAWEQCGGQRLPDGARPGTDAYEIVGVSEPGAGSETQRVRAVVFGGVVRGDGKTGRLADACTRLSKTAVIV